VKRETISRLKAYNVWRFTKKVTAMIRTLRKRHLQIWILWAVLLPVGIIVAWMAVPEKVTQELLQPPGSGTSIIQMRSADTLKTK
jgi:hypothetical protein